MTDDKTLWLHNAVSTPSKVQLNLNEGNFLNIAILTLKTGINEYQSLHNADMTDVIQAMQQALSTLNNVN